MSGWRCWIIAAALIVGLASSLPAHAGSKTIELEINGLVAQADLVVPDGGSIKEQVILITHGTLAHKDMELVEALQTALAERGLPSLAHTLTLGINKRKGMYDCAQPATHRHEDALDEIAAWLGWLKKQGAGQVSLLGHSRGGNQTAWYAAEQGGKDIKNIILLAPATRAEGGSAQASYRARFKADLAVILKDAKALIASGKPKEMMNLPGFLYCTDAKAEARSVVSYYGGDPRGDTPFLLPKLKMPALVIAGSEDTVVPAVAKRIRPIADGKRVKLEVIEGAGHMFLDFYIEDVADLVVKFTGE